MNNMQKKKNVSDWVRTKALIFTLSESRKKSITYFLNMIV